MSLSTASSTGYPYANQNAACGSGGGVLKSIEAVPTDVVDGVEDVGEAVGDVASATVSFSARAMQALANGGMAVVHGVEDVVAFPFEMAADAAEGVEHVVEGGARLLANGVEAVVNGAANAIHAVAVDLPTAIANDVSQISQTALGDATTVAGAAAGVAALTGTSPIKVISAIV
jgi:hypothetical protein